MPWNKGVPRRGRCRKRTRRPSRRISCPSAVGIKKRPIQRSFSRVHRSIDEQSMTTTTTPSSISFWCFVRGTLKDFQRSFKEDIDVVGRGSSPFRAPSRTDCRRRCSASCAQSAAAGGRPTPTPTAWASRRRCGCWGRPTGRSAWCGPARNRPPPPTGPEMVNKKWNNSVLTGAGAPFFSPNIDTSIDTYRE